MQLLGRHRSFEATQDDLLAADSAMRQAMGALEPSEAATVGSLTKPLGKAPTRVPANAAGTPDRRKPNA